MHAITAPLNVTRLPQAQILLGCTCTKTVLCDLQLRTIRKKKRTWRTPLFISPTMLSIEAMGKIKRKKASLEFGWVFQSYIKIFLLYYEIGFWSIRFIQKQIYLHRKLKSFSCEVLLNGKNNFTETSPKGTSWCHIYLLLWYCLINLLPGPFHRRGRVCPSSLFTFFEYSTVWLFRPCKPYVF